MVAEGDVEVADEDLVSGLDRQVVLEERVDAGAGLLAAADELSQSAEPTCHPLEHDNHGHNTRPDHRFLR